MLNQIILVGRLATEPTIKELEDGRKKGEITLAVTRSFKNENGEYDIDYIDITLWTGIAENTAECCKKGDVIGVKGRIETRTITNKDGAKSSHMEAVAEKVTFLSSARKDEE